VLNSALTRGAHFWNLFEQKTLVSEGNPKESLTERLEKQLVELRDYAPVNFTFPTVTI
jgi:hypothetical protein